MKIFDPTYILGLWRAYGAYSYKYSDIFGILALDADQTAVLVSALTMLP